MTRIDSRLRAAVDASLSWYDALCALHGVRCGIEGGTWIAYDSPPPLHSVAKTVEPGTGPERALAALEAHGSGSIADSFGDSNFSGTGLDLLFDARWIHLDAPEPPPVSPPRWSVVDARGDLHPWTTRHGSTAVLLPDLLHRSSFRVLAHLVDAAPTAGAIARLGTGVVEISNVWASPQDELDWSELVPAVAAQFPGRALVGWEHGPELEHAEHAGFSAVGPQHVWVRPA